MSIKKTTHTNPTLTNPTSTKPQLLFADETLYESKNEMERFYKSNIMERIEKNIGTKYEYMPLFTIHYNSGNKMWGVGGNGMFRETKWFSNPNQCYIYADYLYQKIEIMPEIKIRETGEMSYWKKTKNSRYNNLPARYKCFGYDWELVHKTTYFSTIPWAAVLPQYPHNGLF